ncbi:MAG TPA: OsmC family protein [Microbacteriaceae bacterium]
MNLEHHYAVAMQWTGNRGTGTSGYKEYGRDHVLHADGKPDIAGSSDRVFFGDADRWNPEELLLAALSQCHMLSYLHVAARHGVQVLAYSDSATGTMQQDDSDGGHFTLAVLRPRVTIADPAQLEMAQSLHEEAAQKCFIAASVNFPVTHDPETYPAV